MSELGQRVAVAAVGVPAVLALAYLGGWYISVLVALFAALGSLELSRMARAVGVVPFAVLGAVTAAGLVLLAAWRPTFAAFAPWGLAAVAALLALSVPLAIWTRGPGGKPLSTVGFTLFGALYTGLALSVVPLMDALPDARGWAATAGAAGAGLLVLALPLAATWIGDATAYFAGSAWGKSKMAPSISPKKSWVGFWAELIGAGAAGAVWHLVVATRLPGLELGLAVAAGLGVALGLGAVVGDLAESLFKREAGVKDSGTFFPGHGGVLDRLDSLLVTIPMAYVALATLGGAP